MVMTGCDFQTAGQPLTYKEDIKQIVRTYCQECHVQGTEEYEKSGLLMDNYCNLMKGTKFGPVIVPGRRSPERCICL
jgi:hypothetical protein